MERFAVESGDLSLGQDQSQMFQRAQNDIVVPVCSKDQVLVLQLEIRQLLAFVIQFFFALGPLLTQDLHRLGRQAALALVVRRDVGIDHRIDDVGRFVRIRAR